MRKGHERKQVKHVNMEVEHIEQ